MCNLKMREMWKCENVRIWECENVLIWKFENEKLQNFGFYNFINLSMNILGFMLPSTDFLLIVPLFPILLLRHARLLTFTFCSLLSTELRIINYGEGYHPKLTAKSSELYFSTIRSRKRIRPQVHEGRKDSSYVGMTSWRKMKCWSLNFQLIQRT